MHPLERFVKKILAIFRMDLQLHFFWSLCLTLLAVYWSPMLYSGIVVTVGKETLDVVAQKGWSWGELGSWGMQASVANPTPTTPSWIPLALVNGVPPPIDKMKFCLKI